MKSTVTLLLALIPTTVALKCWEGRGNATMFNPPPNLVECGASTLSCTKVIDNIMNTAYKACSPTNCTTNNQFGGPPGPAICAASNYNNGNPIGNSTTCCCYGDGCNGDQGKAFAVAITVTLVAGFLML